MKKIISLLLVIFICSASILPVFAADSNEYTQNSILVDYDGTEIYVGVFVADDATILVPADILTWFGGLNRKTEGSEYIYYQSNDAIGSYELSREIRISKNGSYGKSVIKIQQEKSLSGVSVNFKDSYTYDGDLFLPLEEIVPFLDAKIEITLDGILHIYPNPVSIFEALSYGDLSDMLDPDYDDDDYNVLFDISDGNGVAGLSMFVDTIMGRLDRLDFIFDSGTIKDYKKLYEKMLVQNETYLAAFDKEETPYDTELTTIKKHLKEGSEHFELVDGLLKKTEKVLKYAVGSEKFKNYQNFSDSIDSFGLATEVADHIYKAANYADVLYKMVDDHHEMLYVVYENGDVKRTPAGKAANEVADLYGESTGKKVKSLCVSTLRDYIADEMIDYLTKPIKPYLIVCNAIKALIPGDLSDDYDQIYIDTIVADSREAFVGYYNNMSFNAESLNDLRLSLLMTMLASKYGYDISAMFDTTAYPNSIKSTNRIKVDNWLEKLYLAADSVECSTPEYYNRTKKELSKIVGNLALGDNTNPDNPDNPVIPDTPITPDISTPSQGFEFTLNDDGKSYSVTGIGTCVDKNIVIPTIYNDMPVTVIGDEALYWEDSLTSVIVPDTVTRIGKNAFSRCYSLASVIIGNSVKNIDDYAFRNCKSLQDVTLGNSVENIGKFAFEDCETLKSIIIPNSVTDIAEGVFSGCTSLENVIIGGSLTYIKDYTFKHCHSLKSITIPDSLIGIDREAFMFAGLENITLPASLTYIGYSAFSASKLKSIVISGSVKSIYEEAFSSCSSLVNIAIPASVTYIGKRAFSGCPLTSATFENPSNWYRKYYFWSNSEGIKTDLTNPTSAAKYLSDSYYNDWVWFVKN